MTQLQESPTSNPAAVAAPQGRLLSLDVFRGITIAGMLLVNNAGDWDHIFQPLEHAAWHGCTSTDLIFPSFLFIMGVAMTFSFARRTADAANTGKLLMQIVRRTAILFLLGLALNGMAYWALHNPGDPGKLRILGVLQRIAICYFVVALILLSGARQRAQALIAVALLLIYHVLMKYVPVPGYGRGVLENPGNLASWLDNRLLGPHAYELNEKTGTWHDPEGLLSTLPAIASTLTGTLAGYWLRDTLRDGYEKVAGLFLAGCTLIVASRLWAFQFPYNKNLWSPSYVLLSSGWAMNGLAACMWLVDLKARRKWATPFLVFGTNAIATYFGVGLMAYWTVGQRVNWGGGAPMRLKTWIYTHLYKSWIPAISSDYVSSAAYGLTYVLLWMIIMYPLYRKRIFIKV